MLEFLRLANVGPAPEMKMDLAPRLNIITGDNGLGKTLLLDCVWWALARTWPVTWAGKGVVPEKDEATIEWTERRGDSAVLVAGQYDFANSFWKRSIERDPSTREGRHPRSRQDGPLLVYLRVDGGISVHDPLRVGHERRLPFGQEIGGTTNAFQFREADIWDGLEVREDKRLRVCEGLVRDVVRWAVEAESKEFAQLAALVERLAGEELFRLTHRVGRVYADDARDFPFLEGPAGEVPAAFAPAGLRRILGLAYLLVWTMREHRVAAGLKKRPQARSLVLLVDEVESHLHPKWQRTILPSLLRALGDDIQLQIIATTHSPLVLASAEPFFDADEDAWFDLDVEREGVVLRKRPYVRQGEVGNWLASDAFDLKEPRSLEGERAIRAAQKVLSAERPTRAQIEAADNQLREAGLPDIDRFWVRWGYFLEQHKPAPTRTKRVRKPAAKRITKR